MKHLGFLGACLLLLLAYAFALWHFNLPNSLSDALQIMAMIAGVLLIAGALSWRNNWAVVLLALLLGSLGVFFLISGRYFTCNQVGCGVAEGIFFELCLQGLGILGIGIVGFLLRKKQFRMVFAILSYCFVGGVLIFFPSWIDSTISHAQLEAAKQVWAQGKDESFVSKTLGISFSYPEREFAGDPLRVVESGSIVQLVSEDGRIYSTMKIVRKDPNAEFKTMLRREYEKGHSFPCKLEEGQWGDFESLRIVSPNIPECCMGLCPEYRGESHYFLLDPKHPSRYVNILYDMHQPKLHQASKDPWGDSWYETLRFVD
jgi:hypothetical protein